MEEKFGRLQRDARNELQEQKKSVKWVEDKLDTLPCKIMKENHKFVTELSRRVKPFTNLRVLFQHLHLHCWNFFEYKVLETLIENNCSYELRERMRAYSRAVQSFKDQTKISEFIKSGIADYLGEKIPHVLETFRKFTVQHNIDPDTHTLSELDAFRVKTGYKVCSRFRLLECAIQVYRVKYGSIIVEWMVPEELSDMLRDFFDSEDGQKLMQIHLVEKLLIDGKSVPTVSTIYVSPMYNGLLMHMQH